MKNIINEKPNGKLTGRLKFTVKSFVKKEDIKNKKVLDIGCGYGWFELNALKNGVKEIVGIEITKSDLKTAKENIHDERALFKVAGALKLPFKDNYFDTVVAWEVIEHIPKGTEYKMFKEVSRVLKRNGTFYLSTPFDSFFSNFFDPAYWLIGHRHYSKKMLIDFCKKNNLEVEKIFVRGGYWNLVGLLNMYFSKWILRRNPLFQKYFEEKENQEFGSKNGFMDIFVQYKKR